MVLLALILPGAACSRQHSAYTTAVIVAKMDSLYGQEEYFKLRNIFLANEEQLPKDMQRFYGALVDNAFYAHERSNHRIAKLMEHPDRFTEEELTELHRAQYMNHYNLYEYKEALEVCSLLITDYRHLLDSSVYENLVNERKSLMVLRGHQGQRIVEHPDTWIRIRKDKMGLLNIPVVLGADTSEFLFDTGSSFSFIKRSIAEKAGMEIMDVNFEVEGATGSSVECDLTVAGAIQLGDIRVENAVFWVMDDADVTLPEYDYSVNGAVAFPILRSLEEIHIVFSDSVFVPAHPGTYDLHNLAIDGLDPVLAVAMGADTLPWYFDTGSAFSSLYKPYYDRYHQKIDTTYDQHSFNIGGLGGVKEFTCYIIDSLELEIAGRSARVKDVETHTDYLYKEHEKVFGNLGQDFILQFDKMVINTRHPSVFFE